ncbi:hypothetical protein AVEN_173846-1 [Araneus ventricosus]|uniref:Uncharacterized protein n=1 Tax=Araneus ventricosus TaxID=182803 RepID=A0A4Y2LB21_ARAVE|nr:hypothetical protein AVEN_173846-1 [Araneus ventricosus]
MERCISEIYLHLSEFSWLSGYRVSFRTGVERSNFRGVNDFPKAGHSRLEFSKLFGGLLTRPYQVSYHQFRCVIHWPYGVYPKPITYGQSQSAPHLPDFPRLTPTHTPLPMDSFRREHSPLLVGSYFTFMAECAEWKTNYIGFPNFPCLHQFSSDFNIEEVFWHDVCQME